MSVVEFYHYTSETSAGEIIKSGVICESLDGGKDANFGQGVYGTKLDPSMGKKKIAFNNYLQGWETREVQGRVDYCIMVKLPKNKVVEFKTPEQHVYLHKGPIKINDYTWECLVVGKKPENS